MDVNYARWMSKDPDEPDVIEDEPRRSRVPWPSRSAVATTAVVSLALLGGSAVVRSMSTPEVTADQAQSVEAPAAEATDGPGAAGVEEPESGASTFDESIADGSTSDYSTSDDDSTDDDAIDDSVPPRPRLVFRGELRRPDDLRPGRPMHDRDVRVHVHGGAGDASVLIVRR